MKKTYANIILLSTTVFVAFMVASIPLNHLSAQNEIKIDSKLKVHKTSVVSVNTLSGVVVVSIDGVNVPVLTDASTTVSLGDGRQTELTALTPGTNLYVFGEYDPLTKNIQSEKIVIRNKSSMSRTSLSRAQLEDLAGQGKVTDNNPADALGLTVK
jgi:hypothetical protein